MRRQELLQKDQSMIPGTQKVIEKFKRRLKGNRCRLLKVFLFPLQIRRYPAPVSTAPTAPSGSGADYFGSYFVRGRAPPQPQPMGPAAPVPSPQRQLVQPPPPTPSAAVQVCAVVREERFFLRDLEILSRPPTPAPPGLIMGIRPQLRWESLSR